jgi:hypothetical protein
MKKPIALLCVAATELFAPSWGNAYELATHGALTFHAYTASALSTDPQLVKDLGN